MHEQSLGNLSEPLYREKEAAQSKQQIFLSDLKTSLNQIRHDAQRKLSDYQREISAVEKEVSTAEKRVSRSKEAQEKGLDYRSKYALSKFVSLCVDYCLIYSLFY